MGFREGVCNRSSGSRTQTAAAVTEAGDVTVGTSLAES
jgi:hypothetical protein